jgi:hypothetical protein
VATLITILLHTELASNRTGKVDAFLGEGTAMTKKSLCLTASFLLKGFTKAGHILWGAIIEWPCKFSKAVFFNLLKEGKKVSKAIVVQFFCILSN